MSPIQVPIDDASRIAEARRLAVRASREEGLGESQSNDIGIIATEAATNLWKHARGGEIYVSRLSHSGGAGVEILSIDRGPGMANLERCIADGYSTAGTAGTGLGAISRLSQEFDAYSQPGKGTVLVARHTNRMPSRIGAVVVPMRGETVCGDAWCVRSGEHGTAIFVADGLGHGVLAADASKAAVDAFIRTPADASPPALIEAIHQSLRSTRGAAVAVAFLEPTRQRIRYAGLGNISGVILGGAKMQYMLSHNGTAGHQARRFQEFEYALPPDGVVVMHSDGLATSWSLDSYPGLLRRDPAVIAGVLYRDATRGRDDACVVVVRSSPA